MIGSERRTCAARGVGNDVAGDLLRRGMDAETQRVCPGGKRSVTSRRIGESGMGRRERRQPPSRLPREGFIARWNGFRWFSLILRWPCERISTGSCPGSAPRPCSGHPESFERKGSRARFLASSAMIHRDRKRHRPRTDGILVPFHCSDVGSGKNPPSDRCLVRCRPTGPRLPSRSDREADGLRRRGSRTGPCPGRGEVREAGPGSRFRRGPDSHVH